MKITVKTGLICALVWIVIKISFHQIWKDTTNLTPLIFINMFLIVASISIGLYLHKRREKGEKGNALSDIKAAMTAGVPYAVIISTFMYFYYAKINPGFNEKQIAASEKQLNIVLNDPKQVKEIKKQESMEVLTTKEIYTQQMKSFESVFNPKSTSIIALLGMILLTTFYAIIVTTVYRKVLFRD